MPSSQGTRGTESPGQLGSTSTLRLVEVLLNVEGQQRAALLRPQGTALHRLFTLQSTAIRRLEGDRAPGVPELFSSP